MQILAAALVAALVLAGLPTVAVAEPDDAEPNDAEPDDAEPDDAEPSDGEPDEAKPDGDDPQPVALASDQLLVRAGPSVRVGLDHDGEVEVDEGLSVSLRSTNLGPPVAGAVTPRLQLTYTDGDPFEWEGATFALGETSTRLTSMGFRFSRPGTVTITGSVTDPDGNDLAVSTSQLEVLGSSELDDDDEPEETPSDPDDPDDGDDVGTNIRVLDGAHAEAPEVEALLIDPGPGTAIAAGLLADRLTARLLATPALTRTGPPLLELGEALPASQAVDLAARLVDAGLVRAAEPVLPVHTAAIPPNDPRYDEQWHLTSRQNGTEVEGIDVESAWAITTGSPEVTVAVVDSGQLAHPDLVDRQIAGYDLITDDARARRTEGAGRNPDPTDRGDWTDSSNSSWHGTHVAGTIGATTDNGRGVAGIDHEAAIQHVRVLGSGGGTSADLADGVRWAAGAPDVTGTDLNATPAGVINLSLSGSNSCPASVQAAFDDATASDAVSVVAAGNAGADLSVTPAFPATCDDVITVAASTIDGDLTGYSNHGWDVDLAAPGGDSAGGVLSTFNAGPKTATTQDGTPTDDYAFLAGTSMATPHVSGVLSLMRAANQGLSERQLRAILTDPLVLRAFPEDSNCTADPLAADPDAGVTYCGQGLLDAGSAVAAAADPGPLVTVDGPRRTPAGEPTDLLVTVANLGTQVLEAGEVVLDLRSSSGDLPSGTFSVDGGGEQQLDLDAQGRTAIPITVLAAAGDDGAPSPDTTTIELNLIYPDTDHELVATVTGILSDPEQPSRVSSSVDPTELELFLGDADAVSTELGVFVASAYGLPFEGIDVTLTTDPGVEPDTVPDEDAGGTDLDPAVQESDLTVLPAATRTTDADGWVTYTVETSTPGTWSLAAIAGEVELGTAQLRVLADQPDEADAEEDPDPTPPPDEDGDDSGEAAGDDGAGGGGAAPPPSGGGGGGAPPPADDGGGDTGGGDDDAPDQEPGDDSADGDDGSAEDGAELADDPEGDTADTDDPTGDQLDADAGEQDGDTTPDPDTDTSTPPEPSDDDAPDPAAGEQSASLDGAPVETEVLVGEDADRVTVSTAGVRIDIATSPSTTADGPRISGRTLLIPPASTVPVELEGLAPSSVARVSMRSEPVELWSGEVGADGRLEVALAVPDDAAPGVHHLDVEVWTADTKALRVSIGILVPLPPFPDVPADSVHELAITRLAALGGTTGRADGTYGPSGTVTRGQMASFLARTLGLLDDAADGDGHATDERDGHLEDTIGSVHAEAVQAVVAAGIAQGYGDGRFGIGDPIRRDQMASMLAAAADLPSAPGSGFVDVEGNVHRAAIDAIAAAGITQGISEDRYAPELTVRRDQMASFLTRLLDTEPITTDQR